MTELLGVLATAFIIVAFLMHDELCIRIIDSIGALLFIVYGILINSLSICILNSTLTVIQVINIIKIVYKRNK